MAEQMVTVGGRDYEVACQDGEEAYLLTAAALLDAEARGVLDQIGRLPEVKVLLMAGLVLADRAANSEQQIKRAEARAEALEVEIAELRAAVAAAGEPAVPAAARDAMARLAQRSEALAAEVEKMGGAG